MGLLLALQPPDCAFDAAEAVLVFGAQLVDLG
jgi:hypothetical protein